MTRAFGTTLVFLISILGTSHARACEVLDEATPNTIEPSPLPKPRFAIQMTPLALLEFGEGQTGFPLTELDVRLTEKFVIGAHASRFHAGTDPYRARVRYSGETDAGQIRAGLTAKYFVLGAFQTGPSLDLTQEWGQSALGGRVVNHFTHATAQVAYHFATSRIGRLPLNLQMSAAAGLGYTSNSNCRADYYCNPHTSPGADEWFSMSYNDQWFFPDVALRVGLSF